MNNINTYNARTFTILKSELQKWVDIGYWILSETNDYYVVMKIITPQLNQTVSNEERDMT